MNPIDRLAQYFSKFPGIGERQSKRFVHFLLTRDTGYLDELSRLVANLKKEIAQCSECFRFFQVGHLQRTKCDVCLSTEYDPTILMVLEKEIDYESIRRSGVYKGKFFILGGLIPLVEKGLEKRVRINELLEIVKEKTKNDVLKEIILAFSLNPQGDHTDMHIRSILVPLSESAHFKVSSLGRGLSTGTELEYSDNETLKNALKNRG